MNGEGSHVPCSLAPEISVTIVFSFLIPKNVLSPCSQDSLSLFTFSPVKISYVPLFPKIPGRESIPRAL